MPSQSLPLGAAPGSLIATLGTALTAPASQQVLDISVPSEPVLQNGQTYFAVLTPVDPAFNALVTWVGSPDAPGAGLFVSVSPSGQGGWTPYSLFGPYSGNEFGGGLTLEADGTPVQAPPSSVLPEPGNFVVPVGIFLPLMVFLRLRRVELRATLSHPL